MTNEASIPSIDLSEKSVEELKKLQDQVAFQIQETERKNVIDFYEKFEKEAATLGFSSIQDLHSKYLEFKAQTKKTAKKANITPIYRSKTDPSNTWTGRGKHPRWLVQEAKDGNIAIADLLPSLLIANQ